MDAEDPVIASYDVFLTDSQISRYVFQYPDRDCGERNKRNTGGPYAESTGQKPLVLRQKPKTGLVEIDVPINTSPDSYDFNKGHKYGEAMSESRVLKGGGAFGLAGGFNPNAASARGVKLEGEEGGEEVSSSVLEAMAGKSKTQTILRTQTLAGRIKEPYDGEPLYMLGAFRGSRESFFSPVSAVVQLRPQLHHLDAMEETSKARAMRGRKDTEEEAAVREPEARPVDVKVKPAEGGESVVSGNIELLKNMQEERWESLEWVDADTEDAWATYENYMIHNEPETLPQLKSAIDGESYLDAMSAPRVDPAHPEMTGWAMKQNRKKKDEAAE
ncbi:DNA-directed RNA polymerase III subunit Rpc5 [Talaromyces proteolyticus]|uniref:DNA-directed RNA polymerase III subunit Rpc5 n=1 Tax=Talaromyces proteolyticus TaxID=1131652 RepID=A0AAD4KQ93_9EURO|nr:DNA-directed RNA polymerase III subunit Rpc5 [Talaromyces proteolyticus]KAH8696543.1 DNA-directed RNA polymerase III subunit Rpc5 [Talaromyces proteolyticus]